VGGGVAGQLAQFLGGEARADSAGDVQGLVPDRGGVERAPVAIVRLASMIRQVAWERTCSAAAAQCNLVAVQHCNEVAACRCY
jgi:hypothetical protein